MCYLSVNWTFLWFLFPLSIFFPPPPLPNDSKHLHTLLSTLSLEHCACYLRPYIPTSTVTLFNLPCKRMCGSAFSSRPIVKVGLFPCVAPCAGSAYPRQHHPSQPRHAGHPGDPWRGGPEPWGAGPDDLDGEVRWRASQASRCSHTRGNQRYLQHEAVSALKYFLKPF